MKKSTSRALPYSASDALRHQGFVPLPRLWVKKEDMPVIHAIAHSYAKEVSTLRSKVASVNQALTQETTKQSSEIEQAWEMHEQKKKGTP